MGAIAWRCSSASVLESHRDAIMWTWCDVVVKRRDQKVTLKVNDGPQYVDSHEEHHDFLYGGYELDVGWIFQP